MMLYHGSNNFITDCIEPRVSFDYKPLVYATDDLAYAIVRSGAFNILDDDIVIKEDYDGEKLTLVELKDGSFNKVFNTFGYVYVINEEYFNKSDNGLEYVSENKVPYVYVIKIDNVLSTISSITNSKVGLVWHKDNDMYFNKTGIDKNEYLTRRKQRRKILAKAYKNVED